MYITPILQYLSNLFPWWDSELITDNVVIGTNLIIMVFIITMNISSKGLKPRVLNKTLYLKNENEVLKITFYISFIISNSIIYKTGFSNLFSRSTNNINGLGHMGTLIVNNNLAIFL